MTEEKRFETKIKKFLIENQCWLIKYWGGGDYTKAGIPDILCCCNGKFVAIEVKATKGKASSLQTYNLAKINEAGGYAILLYPKDFEQFQKFIKLVIAENTMCDEIYSKTFKGRWV